MNLQTPALFTRRLKVEPLDEQCAQAVTKTMIRLKGRWLKEAGFASGRHIEVICERPGRLILRDNSVDLATPFPLTT